MSEDSTSSLLSMSCVRAILNRLVTSHTSHHLYAIYQLGATPELLEAAYNVDAKMQRKAFDSPGEITAENWKEHLGDERSEEIHHLALLTCYNMLFI